MGASTTASVCERDGNEDQTRGSSTASVVTSVSRMRDSCGHGGPDGAQGVGDVEQPGRV
ncbi:hypothetical protein ACIOZL_30830 [Streptomyces sp. NPDC087769]|uniref:hypothetical protein n=1 Tax=unclassified Streptomyces TaxID=2593676 RepID=UPI0037028B0E